jgi:hypothetical protein
MKSDNLAIYITLLTLVIIIGIAAIKHEAPEYKQEETATISVTEFEPETEPETTESILAGIARYNAEQVAIKEKLLAERYSEYETTTAYEWQPYPIGLDDDIQRAIKAVCDRYEIAYNLVIAVAMQESNLDPLAVGDNGRAFGLGQIREEYWSETAAELGLTEWKTDAVQNAEMICFILCKHLNSGSTMETALNIYRHGKAEDCVEPDEETYVAKIKRNLEYLEQFTN